MVRTGTGIIHERSIVGDILGDYLVSRFVRNFKVVRKRKVVSSKLNFYVVYATPLLNYISCFVRGSILKTIFKLFTMHTSIFPYPTLPVSEDTQLQSCWTQGKVGSFAVYKLRINLVMQYHGFTALSIIERKRVRGVALSHIWSTAYYWRI